jgi:hypothetical protein
MQTLDTPHYEGGFHKSLYEFIEKRWGFREDAQTPETKVQ